MGLLSKEAFTSGGLDLPTERVEVPELGSDNYVIVKGLTGAQRDAYEKAMWITRGGKRILADNVRAKLIVKCLVDETGTRMYQDSDAEAVGKVRGDVLERIFDACRRVSGMSDEALEEKKEPSDA